MARGRRSRSRRGRGGSDINWQALILGLGVLMAIATLGFLSATIEQKKINDVTLCIEGEAHPSILAIVIDATDSLPPGPAKRIYDKVQRAIAEAPMNTLIEVFEIKGSSQSLGSAALSICKPDDGEDASVWNSAPDYIKSIYSERFDQPLEEVFERLMSAAPANRSPIIETIQAASLSAFMPNQNVASKKLIIASDFLQHSELYSMYSREPDFSEYRSLTLTSPLGTVKVYGAEVEMLVIPRSIPKGGRADLVKFWTDFYGAAGWGLGSTVEPL